MANLEQMPQPKNTFEQDVEAMLNGFQEVEDKLDELIILDTKGNPEAEAVKAKAQAEVSKAVAAGKGLIRQSPSFSKVLEQLNTAKKATPGVPEKIPQATDEAGEAWMATDRGVMAEERKSKEKPSEAA